MLLIWHTVSVRQIDITKHGGHRVTQNRSSSPFILFSGYPRHWRLIFSVQEVLEMVARDEEMDVDVEGEANEEVTLIERIKECLKEVGDAGIDVDFLVDTGVSMLVPLYELSRRRVAGLPDP